MPRRYRSVLLILFVFTLSACGRGDTGRTEADLGSGALRWNSFPVQVFADSFLLADTDAALDLQDAMDFWENRAGRRLFVMAGGWDNSRVPYIGSAANPDELLANVTAVPFGAQHKSRKA